jgi:hypothetical protein
MEAKVIGEQLAEQNQKKPERMSLELQVQMYDNENRNLRNERQRML